MSVAIHNKKEITTVAEALESFGTRAKEAYQFLKSGGYTQVIYDPSGKVSPALTEKYRQTPLTKLGKDYRAVTLLEFYRDTLVERLDIGAAKIEEGRAQGKDVSTWEDYWIELLHKYEGVCDKIRDSQLVEA